MFKIGLAAGESSSELLSFFLALAILIAAAKIVGSISVRVGQPAVLGELAAGLLLGPTFIDLLAMPAFRETDIGNTIHQIGQVGVIWLMFSAGMEIELRDLRRSGRPAVLSGVLGVAVPLLMGSLVALAFGIPTVDGVFIGITLSATSVSISAQTLLELARLRSREGVALLGAAVIDDVLVIVFFSVFTAFVLGESGPAAILLQLVQMIGGLLLVGLLAVYVFPRIAEWGAGLRASEGLLAIVLAVVLSLAWLAEFVGGVAAITGAFLAGLGLGKSHLRGEIERGLHALAYAFFVPLFLVDIGLQSNVLALRGEQVTFALVVIAIAIFSKVIGGGLGARIGGFDTGASFLMGVGMVSRGEVGLIIAGVGVMEGILPAELFTIIVLMVLTTTLVTPPLLRWAFSREEAANAATNQSGGL